jgi:hypothetical protein
MMAGALGGGLFAISKGLIIEPSARVTRAVDTINTWIAKRAGAILGPAQ